jgi:hypothetical protein
VAYALLVVVGGTHVAIAAAGFGLASIGIAGSVTRARAGLR